jgi:hypothetical protein
LFNEVCELCEVDALQALFAKETEKSTSKSKP